MASLPNTPISSSKEGQWQIGGGLFPPLGEDIRKALELLPRALEDVWPLKKKWRENLPDDIAALSRILTSARNELERPYWSKPAFISAYLYYFFPWNLIRLLRLLAGLDIAEPAEKEGLASLLLDAGSGPLTFPIALWLARKQWRHRPINAVCLDKAIQPLETGKKLFIRIAELLQGKAWSIHLFRGNLDALPAFGHKTSGSPWLVSAINTLNEFKNRSEDDDEEDFSGNLFYKWASLWEKGSQMLFVEPGTRLGGKIIMNLRNDALEAGIRPASPCTHSGACPLKDDDKHQRRTWCHFTFAADGAPQWLLKLSKASGLYKTALSLSFLFMKSDNENRIENTRIVSQGFEIPGLKGKCRYGCSNKGLVLLPDAAKIVSGSLVKGLIVKNRRDAKSGALFMEPEN